MSLKKVLSMLTSNDRGAIKHLHRLCKLTKN